MNIDLNQYRKKVMGCWVGKAVGGTLGQPYEGQKGPFNLEFYDPVPTGVIPNDDLDLQVVWLEQIRRFGLPVDRRILADAWLRHIYCWPGEYGICSRNMRLGIMPPLSGQFNNGFPAGMGAAIRTEIWACLAPGAPELAKRLSLEDACVDHGPEGIYAARFLVVVESLAFICSDRDQLIDEGLRHLPPESRVRQAITDCRNWWAEAGDWNVVRSQLIEKYAVPDWTDVAINLAFIILGWLAGDDFPSRICAAVNAGFDTDCTGATLGSILGIIDPDSIPAEWLKPIGLELALSPGMCGMHAPADIHKFSEAVIQIQQAVQDYYQPPARVDYSGCKETFSLGPLPPPRHQHPELIHIWDSQSDRLSILSETPLRIGLLYPPGTVLPPHSPTQYSLLLANPGEDVVDLEFSLSVPDGLRLDSPQGRLSIAPGETAVHTFTVTAENLPIRVYRHDLIIRTTISGILMHYTAGLVTALPWGTRVLAEGELPDAPPQPERIAEIGGSFFQLPAHEGRLYSIRFKAPYARRIKYIVEGERPIRAWLDGEKILDYAGSTIWASIHGHGTSAANIDTCRGWHQLTIVIGAGPEATPVFWALGDGPSWSWIPELEYAEPDMG